MGALFAGVALMNTAMVGASTAGTLVAAEINGPAWSGLPSAAGVLGTALGALGAGTLLARRGRRFALLGLYGLGAGGATVAVAGALASSLLLLVTGMVLLGLGNGAAQLSRYLAAELYPAERRATGLSTIVWAGTVGAVAGPALIAPAAGVAERLNLPGPSGLSGPIAAAALVTVGAALAVTALPRPAATQAAPAATGLTPRTALAALRRPVVLTPLCAMVAAQVAMVAVMSMTPLQLHQHGHGLDVVSWVLALHMVGMFALAPVSGRIADRWGGLRTIGGGIGLLVVAAATVVLAPTAHTSGLPIALFLLGYGWNLVFVGGSGLLSRDLPAEQRSQQQGAVDALVWGASAVASLLAGQLFNGGGYVLVAVTAGLLAMAPLVLLARHGAR